MGLRKPQKVNSSGEDFGHITNWWRNGS